QAFLAIDAILILLANVTDGRVVYPQVIAKNLAEELPFMATENFIMAGVAAGGGGRALHGRIRQHSQEAGGVREQHGSARGLIPHHSQAAAAVWKQQGASNDLISRLRSDPAFAKVNLDAALDASKFVGRAPEQVDEFIADVVAPIRERYGDSLSVAGEGVKV